MRSLRVIGIGITATMISAAAWLGCSSDDSTPPADAGLDATGSSSSGGSSSSSSGAGSSSSGGSSSSSGAGDSGRDATLDAAVEAAIGTDAGDAGTVIDASDASLVTWQQVYGDVISQHCVGCHAPPVGDAAAGGGFRVGHLDMGTVDAGYLNLINQPPQGTGSALPDAAVCSTLSVDAGSDSGLLRVRPGDPSLSLIYDKVNGYVTLPPCGAPMPPTIVGVSSEIPDGGQAAAAAEIQQWILQGANP